MGVRIHVYLSHDLARWEDSAEALARLAGCLDSAKKVGDYWRAQGDHEGLDRWVAEPIIPRLPHQRDYSGPGSLYVAITPRCMRISTGGRWRGLLSIEPLRRVYVAAFRSIADGFGSEWMALCGNVDEVWDVFLEGGSQPDCIAELRKTLGPPRRLLELENAEFDPLVGRVWFLDCSRDEIF